VGAADDIFAPNRPGPQLVFFAYFAYKKIPTGQAFCHLNIFSRKICQGLCGEYVWEGEKKKVPRKE
jgi:hypothetical protein